MATELGCRTTSYWIVAREPLTPTLSRREREKSPSPRPSPGVAKTKGAAGKAVVWPAGDLKWVDAAGAPPGVKQAYLWGDPTKGAFGALEKFPPGFSAALHTHSADLRIVVLSGTVIHGPEGKPEVRLGAGSYLMLPSTYRHTTACDKSSECVFFLEGNGKFDVKSVDEGKAPAKN
jgi:quercetin dioxygenase-like cupin family protein